MNKVLVTLFAGLVATGVYAADDVKKSRSVVKAEAATANKKGEIADGDFTALAATAETKLSKDEMAALRAKVKAERLRVNSAPHELMAKRSTPGYLALQSDSYLVSAPFTPSTP